MKKGYEFSLMTDDLEHCYICGSKAIQYHHIFNASARGKATEDHLWIPVCFNCHVKIHNERSQRLNYSLKRDGQLKYEETHTHQEYMDRYGKNYL